ncbi:HNH endonuclease [Pontibacillus sp. HMF3514]|uniref:HNH endonuclease n=1 Tax=Pontibacillus sp. HMF3514 TaxID=2692425 RepID=UPI00132037C7|nr:HNH endonuclease [Pontibacillus sp. HMF3514]QHE52779.1 hypothetical protein GS400_12420 [Pontibacillus sp. HMF3514]
MVLSERQKKFIEYVNKENRKEIDVNDGEKMFKYIVLNLFQLYLLSTKESDKMQVAWNIHSIKPHLKDNIKIWHIIEDKDEYKCLLYKKQEQIESYAKKNQERRHQKRDDFALNDQEWEEVKRYFGYKCAYCGSESKLTYDHFHPFSKGGGFMKGNIIPCCRQCNSSKRDRIFNEWYPEQNTIYDESRKNKVLEYIKSNKQLTLL